jgi:hypothetical protein
MHIVIPKRCGKRQKSFLMIGLRKNRKATYEMMLAETATAG